MITLVVDLDDTLANATKRLLKAGEEPPRGNVAEMQKWLDHLQTKQSVLDDEAIKEVAWLVSIADQWGAEVVYLTGRSEKYREATTNWLTKHSLPRGPLFMRHNDDWSTPGEYKRLQLVLIQRRSPETKAFIAIDDDKDGTTAPVYSELGIRHLKVMPMKESA